MPQPFRFLYGIGEKRLKNLAKRLGENGIVPRVHGNYQRLPKHTYQSVAELLESAIKSVAYTSFCRLWRSLLPSVVVMKPMTDLCWQCQKNSTAILRTSNNADAVKSKASIYALEHLRIVKLEPSLYKSVCNQCKDDVLSYFTIGSVFQPPPLNLLWIHNPFVPIIYAIMPSRFTYAIMPSRFTSHRIHCNQGQFS